MDKQSIRIVFIMTIIFIALQLFLDNRTSNKKTVPSTETTQDTPSISRTPEPFLSRTDQNNVTDVVESKVVEFETDLFKGAINLSGGDIISADLKKYKKNNLTPEEPYTFLTQSGENQYIAQSGIISVDGPDGYDKKAIYNSDKSKHVMLDSDNTLKITLVANLKDGLKIEKIFTFHRDKYLIDIEHSILNQTNSPYTGHVFGQLKRTEPNEKSGFGAMRTFTGAAIGTDQKKYQKIKFKEIKNSPLRQKSIGGWAAMVEHYFVSAWIPPADSSVYYQTKYLGNNSFSINYVGPEFVVLPSSKKSDVSQLYIGPEESTRLKSIYPGLELTIDYGFLWFICQPIFKLLKLIHSFVQNWGLAIILTTIAVKLLFFQLSAKSYRSMGNMKKIQPKMEELKEKYGEDRQKLGQAMMELYRTEKVNPLGGCLPILVQLPVFFSLYYVLLESVELRHAPFVLWITDLSSKDPYFVLPIIMGLSMLLQQKMNPAPPDPIQAKVMMFMPIMFTFLFLQFPSGLVLYWVVNNVLSILQQWAITRKIQT